MEDFLGALVPVDAVLVICPSFGSRVFFLREERTGVACANPPRLETVVMRIDESQCMLSCPVLARIGAAEVQLHVERRFDHCAVHLAGRHVVCIESFRRASFRHEIYVHGIGVEGEPEVPIVQHDVRIFRQPRVAGDLAL